MVSSKHAFWVAFVIASMIFWAGIFLGIYFENSRISRVEDLYLDFETELVDFQLLSEIVFDSDLTCDALYEESIFLADRIYAGAMTLEKYDDSNKITKDLIFLHRRYDLLRTFLWRHLIEVKRNCGEINTLVYLYEYDNPSLTTKGTQGTMSNKLLDLKAEYGDKIILIPIAADTDVSSLEFLMESYGLDKIPAIFLNEKYKFETLESLDEIEAYLSDKKEGENRGDIIHLN